MLTAIIVICITVAVGAIEQDKSIVKSVDKTMTVVRIVDQSMIVVEGDEVDFGMLKKMDNETIFQTYSKCYWSSIPEEAKEWIEEGTIAEMKIDWVMESSPPQIRPIAMTKINE